MTTVNEVIVNADVLVRSDRMIKKVVVRSGADFRLDSEVEVLEFQDAEVGKVTLLPNARVHRVMLPEGVQEEDVLVQEKR